MFEFLNDAFNYEDRKVGKAEINGLIVSTAFSSDEGYETALNDINGWHPVERYESKEDSQKGHEKWCKKAKTVKTIIRLGGFGGLVPDKEIELIRHI